MSKTIGVKRQLQNAVSQNRALSKTGLQERLFANAFTKLVYPQIWEDPEVDMQALDIKPHHNLVCIASGGCNIMSYLTMSPASITAVDLSPAHIALNKLKLVAAKHSPDYRTFHDFFVRGNLSSNVTNYEFFFRPHLDAQSNAYWSSRLGLTGRKIDMFKNGFYHYGLLGKFIRAAHLVARLHGVDLTDFIQCRTLDEQKRFFKSNVEPIFNSRLIKFIAKNRVSLFGLGIPPQQYEELANAAGGDILGALKERTRSLMCNFPLKENYFAWQAFARSYNQDGVGPLPPYLQINNLSKLRELTDRVDVRNETFTRFLSNTAANTKHGYVLLDAQDWMTNEQLNELWGQITRTAAPGARVIFRTAGIPTILPGRVDDSILSHWEYLSETSTKLNKQDRSAIYGGFHIYKLKDN
ncbi:DUF3419 family protein [Lentilitoribacter sp. Alg239-R112]|jgi:S-adenosylmethionine-diacylglycerol 3-amino-3-carboxypropyl transferase|uniref:DUF3419 family protein n=1 Tax=Lentilitoribacter sp. Alg239-R112 TaxID=2305987 RepID=UPI0013A68C3C|nr:DUF3419 family protein [Lentilitoribacter sp. Alg239-R112]